MTRLREDLADRVGHPRRRHLGRERLERGAHRAAAGVRRARAHRRWCSSPRTLLHSRLAGSRTRELVWHALGEAFVITDRADGRGGRRPNPTSCSSARRTTRPATPSRSRPARALAERGSSARGRRRGVRGSSAARPRCRCSPTTQNVRDAHALEGVRARRRAHRLLPRGARGVEDLQRVRLPYHMERAHAGRRHRARSGHADDAIAILDSIREQRDRILDALASMPASTSYPSRRELRAVPRPRARGARSGRLCSTAAS